MIEQFSIKHRPLQFEDIYGQDGIKKELITRARSQNWPRAMMLKGPYGTGKTTAAQLIAMTLQCSDLRDGNRPCGQCPSCKSILEERWDRDTVQLDGGRVGKGDVIDFTSIVNVRPMYDRNRVFIIEESDQLSTAAINTMLKVLENPQSGVYFILLSMVTSSSGAIQSRCQTYNFKPISVKDTMVALREILKKEERWEDPTIPDSFKLEGLATIAESSKGSLREAVQLLEKCLIGEYYTSEAIRDNLNIVDEAGSFHILSGLLAYTKDEAVWASIYKADPEELYNYITLILSGAMLFRKTGYVNDERFLSSTRSLASRPNLPALFNILTSYAPLSKPYVRRADLISAFAQFYETAPTRGPDSVSVNTPTKTPVRMRGYQDASSHAGVRSTLN